MRWKIASRQPEIDLLTHILRERGIEADVNEFISADLADIPDYSILHDSVAAAKIILQAIEDGKKIGIHGDYDVDGVCATAVMWDFLSRGLEYDKVIPYIPNRFDEGYGLSTESLDTLIKQGCELIISVDCGVKDLELIASYSKAGVQFVITDHHNLLVNEEGLPVLPPEAAVVHPLYPNHLYPQQDICGANVAWKLCCAINVESGKGLDMNEYLDLVALATVCDVMPLVAENRAIVKHGLGLMRKNPRLGLRLLITQAGVDYKQLETYHFGFVIGPRINAAGRMDSAMQALRLLLTQSKEQAAKLAETLHNLNAERQELTQQLLIDAEAKVVDQSQQLIYFVYGEAWPEGIVGLVAGKLAEKYFRPVFVGSLSEGRIKASARSPIEFHLAHALKHHAHLLERHGGHALAAGLTVLEANWNEFFTSINQFAREQISFEQFEKQIKIDAELSTSELTSQLVNEISKLEPFGFGNSQPIFAIRNLIVRGIRKFGSNQQHIQFTVQTESKPLNLIAFNESEKWQNISIGATIDVAGTLRVNSWQGANNVEIQVKDILTA